VWGRKLEVKIKEGFIAHKARDVAELLTEDIVAAV
jgi:hypothetical protein